MAVIIVIFMAVIIVIPMAVIIVILMATMVMNVDFSVEVLSLSPNE